MRSSTSTPSWFLRVKSGAGPPGSITVRGAGRVRKRGGWSSRARRRGSQSPFSIAARSASCCSRTAAGDIAGPSTSIVEGCATSRIQSVSACTIRLPPASAIARWISRSAAAIAWGWPSAASARKPLLSLNRRARPRSIQPAARPDRDTSMTSRASTVRRGSRRPVFKSIISMESLRLRPTPRSAVCATKMPPPGPLAARIRLPLASSFSDSRSVGRLTPNSVARSSSRPRKAPGPRPSAGCGAGSRRPPAHWRRGWHGAPHDSCEENRGDGSPTAGRS